jgi:hypothetical protein
MNKRLLKWGGIAFLLGMFVGYIVFVKHAHGDYISPIPTDEIVSPSCTPTPDVTISPIESLTVTLEASPSATPTVTDIPASSDNSAGASASVSMPSFAPAAGKGL